ncbi:hypothetical protein HOY80DRAFT_21001 [Tuber brumale]|nr:hypothetical protein HOY80DRAFT_21001 [Tuber brumale]
MLRPTGTLLFLPSVSIPRLAFLFGTEFLLFPPRMHILLGLRVSSVRFRSGLFCLEKGFSMIYKYIYKLLSLPGILYHNRTSGVVPVLVRKVIFFSHSSAALSEGGEITRHHCDRVTVVDGEKERERASYEPIHISTAPPRIDVDGWKGRRELSCFCEFLF